MSAIAVLLMLLVIKQLVGTTMLDPKDLQISLDTAKMINSIWGYFALAGIGLSTIYFLMELNRKYAFEGTDVTLKTFSVPFVKYAASILVLSKGARIIGALVSIGNAFISFVHGKDFEPGKEAYKDLLDYLTKDSSSIERFFNGVGFFMCLVIIIPLLLGWLVTIVCGLVWKYKALGYKIELLFRMGISPLALADVYSGQNSQAVRWCKSMLATVLYGASFIVVVKLGHAIALKDMVKDFTDLLSKGPGSGADAVWDLFTSMLKMVVVPIAELGCINAVRQALKEALA